MNRWWLEQRRRLWWKEARECWLFIGLGWFVIAALMVLVPVPESSLGVYFWGIQVHSGALAILLFVSLCLGVTAYAVESEYETLTPLLAKPIPLNDIFATKLGVRLGVLFLSMVVLGIIELWTGAWPIEWRIPSPVVFERWASGVMICSLGLGLGLYFGKTLGRQTSAILASGLVFLIGYVYLTLSPLNWIFEGNEERNFYWIRGILLPGLIAAAAMTAAGFARVGEPGFLYRKKGIVTTISLALYALVFWSMTIVPPGEAWVKPALYRDYLKIGLGTPRGGVGILLDRYIDANPDLIDKPDEALAIRMLKDVSIYGIQYTYTYSDDFVRQGYGILGIPSPVYSQQDQRRYVRWETRLERMAAEDRRPEWVTLCLEQVSEIGSSDLEKMAALHLAGVANHTEHVEHVASFLDDPSEHVQMMAYLVLHSFDDPRGMPGLIDLLMNGRHPDLLSYYATRYIGWRIELGAEAGHLFREWAVSPQYNGWRRAGRDWLREHGTIADIDIVRQSLWMESPRRYTEQNKTPDDMYILPYLKDWDSPDYLPQLWELTREYLSEMDIMIPVIEALPPRSKRVTYQTRNRIPAEHWALIRNWTGTRNSFIQYATQLIAEGEREAVEIWLDRRARIFEFSEVGSYYSRRYRHFGDGILGMLPSFGEFGFGILREMVENRQETPRARFQAALILAYHGFEEYHDEAFRILDVFRDHPEFHDDYDLRRVAEAMLVRGHARYAGLIIDFWWDNFDPSTGSYRWYGGLTIESIEHLERVTGQDLDWDIKAWKKWWEREGMHIAASGNNN